MDDIHKISLGIFVISRWTPKDPTSDNLGTTIWDASVILVRYMERNPQLYSRRKLEGKRVLELGAGCGLAGMYFALQGAHVTFTDLVRDE